MRAHSPWFHPIVLQEDEEGHAPKNPPQPIHEAGATEPVLREEDQEEEDGALTRTFTALIPPVPAEGGGAGTGGTNATAGGGATDEAGSALTRTFTAIIPGQAVPSSGGGGEGAVNKKKVAFERACSLTLARERLQKPTAHSSSSTADSPAPEPEPEPEQQEGLAGSKLSRTTTSQLFGRSVPAMDYPTHSSAAAAKATGKATGKATAKVKASAVEAVYICVKKSQVS